MRILFSIWQGIKHRECIHQKKIHGIQSLLDVSAEQLRTKKIQVLALDFDGVLNAHGEKEPTSQNRAWLDTLLKSWQDGHVVILSNKPNQTRIGFFQKHYPSIGFITHVAKKPYPEGLMKVAKLYHVSTQEVLLVDDRLLTGMLACCLAGAQGLYIQKPLSNFYKRPIRESLFSFLRVIERMLFYIQ